jgi:hypothetical protein
MKLCIRRQWLQMRGRLRTECEDACAVSEDIGQHRDFARIAIADGTSSSIFAGRWARKLVDAYCRVETHDAAWPEAEVRAAAQEWAREAWGQNLAWPLQEKLGQGAFATFLGMQFRKSDTGRVVWSAVAMGDSCLFVIKPDAPFSAWPVAHSTSFNQHPFAISTDPARNRLEQLLTLEGVAVTGDRFLLMTDAAAQWFLREHEGGCEPWEALNRRLIADAKGFTRYIRRHQRKQRMRNDDVAVISIELNDG